MHVPEDSRRQDKGQKGQQAQALFGAQGTAKQLPRVEIPRAPMSNEVEPFLPAIRTSRARRPTQILQYGEDPLQHAGIFWWLEDFDEYKILGPKGQQLWALLQECREAELAAISHVHQTGQMLGVQISADGCRAVGLADEVIADMTVGSDLPFDSLPDTPSHWRPYSGMFASVDVLIAALREFVRLLRLGKLLPIDSLAFVEFPTTMIVKASAYKVGGFKYRLCVDLTASRVNGHMYKIDCLMITLDEFIRHTKKGHVIFNMDVADFFRCLPLRKDYLTFFGVQNPLTGGEARCSPPVANRQMCNLTGAVANELRRRERGDTPLPTFSHIAVVMRPNVIDHTRNQDPLHAKSALFLTGLSTLASFVDDAIQSAPTEVLGNELMAIAGHVFQITCIFEKVKKRAAPVQEQEVLGLWFCILSGYLSVPTEKRARLLALVLEALEMFDRQGAILIEALNSLVGKLQDGSQGYVCEIDTATSGPRLPRRNPAWVSMGLAFCPPLPEDATCKRSVDCLLETSMSHFFTTKETKTLSPFFLVSTCHQNHVKSRRMTSNHCAVLHTLKKPSCCWLEHNVLLTVQERIWACCWRIACGTSR